MTSTKRKQKQKKGMPPQADIRRAEVDNPYFNPGHREGATNPKRIHANLNVKESAIETLYARRFLGSAQKKAADQFRAVWEAAGGKASSMDYSQDRVDGGNGDPITARLAAAQELKRCRELLGVRGFETIQKVCAEGRALAEISPHKRERLTMADNLRADLDDLAAMWGLQTRRKM